MTYRAYMAFLLRAHWPAFVLAVFVGLLTTISPLVAEYRMGSLYQGVPPIVIDDQVYYLVRAQEALDGHPTLGNPYLLENKNMSSGQSWIPDMVLARVSMLFGGLSEGRIVFGFVFPFLVILISYAILYILGRDKLISLALAALADPGLVFQAFLRTPHPQLLVLLFMVVLAVLLALQGRGKWWAIMAALIGGSLFYIYPFYWTYYVVMMGLAVPACFILIRESKAYQMLGLILAGSLTLGIPYFIEGYQTSKIPFYHEALQRIGVIETHFPSGIFIVSIVTATLALGLWCWYKRIIPRTPATVFIACTVATGAVVVNQAVITGMNFFFTGHYTQFVLFMCVFALGLCLPALVNTYTSLHYRHAARWILALVLIGITVWNAVPQVVHLATPQARDVAAERYGPILRWLNANTKTDEVVYADNLLSHYIPAYTHNNVFFSTSAQQAFISNKEVQERFVRWHYFDGLTRESVIAGEADVFGAYYLGRWQHAMTTNRLRPLLGMPLDVVDRYPESAIESLIEQERLLQKQSFSSAIRGYEVRYLVWDTLLRPEWHANTVPGLRKLYEANSLEVYAVPPSQ